MWTYTPRESGWITGTAPALSDFQAIEDDIHTWGGNVNGGNNQLTNCAAVAHGVLTLAVATGSSGAQALEISATGAGAQPAIGFYVPSGVSTHQRARLIYDGGAVVTGGGWVFQSLTDAGSFGANLMTLVQSTGMLGVNTVTPTVSGTGKVHFSGDTARIVDAANTPASSAATGNDGEFRIGAAGLLYVHIAGSWYKFTGVTF